MHLRIFYAHPKSESPAAIEGARALIREAWARKGISVEVIPGREEFDRSFAVCGRSWECWCSRWAEGTGLDGAPLFAVIVVPAGPIGKATARGIALALAAGKPVLAWDGFDGWTRATGLDALDGGSWTDCAALRTDGGLAGAPASG